MNGLLIFWGFAGGLACYWGRQALDDVCIIGGARHWIRLVLAVACILLAGAGFMNEMGI